MTVVCWDGETLAADKAATHVGFADTVAKIHRVPGGIVGLAGDGDAAMDLLAWFLAGRVPAEFPACQKGETRASALFIDEQRRVLAYGKSPNPQRIEQRQTAMGAGRDYALAAMFLGCDARRAVEVASHFDCYCGNGIDTLTLE